MSVTLKFGSHVPQATQHAASAIVSPINASGVFQGSKTITISNFSDIQLQQIPKQPGNTNGTDNSQIQINQNFD